jgi:transposase InsO family protein
VLVELGLVEQRYQAVREVLDDGASVTEVARRYGVARQTVHSWLRRYASSGLAGLADRSCRPASCPHQMAPAVETRVVELRRTHPGWGPRRIVHQLGRDGMVPVPGRSSVYRALVRHGLVDPKRRRRRRSDYRRWERSRSMELWQLDVMGRVRLLDSTELSVVTGIDDHSRYCVIAQLVRRATARPVCQALQAALERYGLPEAILTDNGKVFTGRFGPARTAVLFDRICHEHGIRHLLTAPHAPTTTGKIERLHKTMRAELFNLRAFATLEEAQAALDAWVTHYNTARPHQGIGDVPPLARFQLAAAEQLPISAAAQPTAAAATAQPAPAVMAARPGGVTRWVDQAGKISLAGCSYHVGRVFAGELVEAVCQHGLVEIRHGGVLLATHSQRRRPNHQPSMRPEAAVRRARAATVGQPVTRVVDSGGNVSFAGTAYRAGRGYARRSVQVALVGGSVQLSLDGRVIRVHPARHDPAKEHGAFATPQGRPRRHRSTVA